MVCDSNGDLRMKVKEIDMGFMVEKVVPIALILNGVFVLTISILALRVMYRNRKARHTERQRSIPS